MRDHAGSLDEMIYTLPFALLVGLVVYLVRRGLQRRRFGEDFKEVRRKVLYNEIIFALFICWAFGLFCMTLLPSGTTGAVWLFLAHFQWLRPFDAPDPWFFDFYPEIFGYLSGTLTDVYGSLFRYIVGLVENIVLFIPLGLFLPFLWKRAKLWKVTLIGLGCTLLIELIQPFLRRNADIEDVICNVLGAVTGYLLFMLIRKLFPHFTEKCMTKVSDLNM